MDVVQVLNDFEIFFKWKMEQIEGENVMRLLHSI